MTCTHPHAVRHKLFGLPASGARALAPFPEGVLR
jgi:hypothetical protein